MTTPNHSTAQGLVTLTERVLTQGKRRRLLKKLKQSRKNPVIDWIEAFLWAAMVVLIINQYVLQAYQIPSPSMRNTLLEGDRIFVNKLAYGPELLPGVLKLPGPETITRGQVLCFVNPRYQSNGPVFMILQRILYMLTLSLVDIDKEGGEPRMYLLIKRTAGLPGDQWRYLDGTFMVKSPGENWITEKEFKALTGQSYRTEKDILPGEYSSKGQALAVSLRRQISGVQDGTEGLINEDPYWSSLTFRREAYRLLPRITQDRGLSEAINGWYVPEDYILPLGDNRDHSNDGRYFGPVPKRDVLGKALFKYWPLTRIGPIL